MRRLALAALSSLTLATCFVSVAQAAPDCFGLRPTVVGTARADVIVGTDGPDVIYGGGGSDTIRGRQGNDRLCGGGTGFDQVSGGGGHDLIEVAGYDPEETEVQEHYASGKGGPGRDRILASGFWTTVHGDGGADAIHGRGVHLLFGDSGDDSITASHRPSTFFQGGAGDDDLVDRTGTGVLVQWEAPRGVKVDLARGTATGWGKDTISGFNSVLGSNFDDILLGGTGNDHLEGLRGDDRLAGRDGDDNLVGYEGADEIFGGRGDDQANGTLDCTAAGSRKECHLPDQVRGGPGADTVAGGEGNDELYGGSENDSVIGGGGHDVAYGGSGNDHLHGYAGDDQLFGQGGEDVLSGYWSTRAVDAEYDLGDTDTLDGGTEADKCFAGEKYLNCEAID